MVLAKAQRSLLEEDGIDVLAGWSWNADSGFWSLTCRLTVATADAEIVARRTDWIVLASEAYPWGPVHIHPAQRNAVERTFPHQLLNRASDPGEAQRPWRTGRLCVDTGVQALGRLGRDPEPFAADMRLVWRLQRARRWLEAASRGELAVSGAPFELPDFGVGERLLVATSEDARSLRAWTAVRATSGRVRLAELRSKPRVLVATAFVDVRGREVWTPSWGDFIAAPDRPFQTGAWLRLPAPPVMPPWQAPTTWAELRAAASSQGADVDEALASVLPLLRDGHAHVLLVGFPIPETVGGEPALLHWQPVVLPPLPPSSAPRRGFRPDATGAHHTTIRAALGNSRALAWARAENWHPNTISVRGRLPPSLTEATVLLIGAGALGAQVAEHLVRGGVRRIGVVDGDVVQAGNLVRHSLGLEDVGRFKAAAVADRLNRAGPHVEARSFTAEFPPQASHGQFAANAREADVIIDCTGEDAVAHAMARFDWRGHKLFVSFSLGVEARMGFAYLAWSEAFPADDMLVQLGPVLDQQRAMVGDQEWPREGVGCWHPVFPARSDQVSSLATAMVGQLATYAEEFAQRGDSGAPAPELHVIGDADRGVGRPAQEVTRGAEGMGEVATPILDASGAGERAS